MKNEVRQRAFGTLLTHAVLRWETLVTLIVTIILFLFFKQPFSWWQDWFWLVAGAIAEGALVVSTLTDPESLEEAIYREFEQSIDVNNIRNPVAREKLKSALEYRRNMIKLVERHKGALRTHLRQTVSDVTQWIEYMYRLAEHIDAFEGNDLVERDLKSVPQKIEKVKIRLSREKDEQVRADLERQLEQLEQQRENLEATVNSIKRAEIQLESTLSSLGTVYAQLSLLGSKEVDSGRAQRLRLDIQDEVASLQDTIEAMDEVQAQQLHLR
ncbi:MAG: hypothetical protein D6712_04390 [Chloroflexi bacterium]|nr:MAG: hypothetical protein D6712_04390 [Chloroflexota bacterium]